MLRGRLDGEEIPAGVGVAACFWPDCASCGNLSTTGRTQLPSSSFVRLVCSVASFCSSLPALRSCLANSQGPLSVSSRRKWLGSCCKQGWQPIPVLWSLYFILGVERPAGSLQGTRKPPACQMNTFPIASTFKNNE